MSGAYPQTTINGRITDIKKCTCYCSCEKLHIGVDLSHGAVYCDVCEERIKP